MDCLDRTNIGQMCISLMVLRKQLIELTDFVSPTLYDLKNTKKTKHKSNIFYCKSKNLPNLTLRKKSFKKAFQQDSRHEGQTFQKKSFFNAPFEFSQRQVQITKSKRYFRIQKGTNIIKKEQK